MDLIKKCNEIIISSIDNIVTTENLKSYLDLVARFPYLSCENQTLLWVQKKDAKLIHGAYAWKTMGRDIKEDEGAIAFLVPQIKLTDPGELMVDEEGNIQVDSKHPMSVIYKRQMVYEYGSKVLGVYDISQTTGEKPPKIEDHFDFEGNIKKRGLIISEAPKAELDGKNYMATEEGIIINSEIASDKERERALICGYIEYMLKIKDIPKKHLKELLFSTKYVCQMHFLSDAKEKMFGWVDSAVFTNTRDKQYFLGDISTRCMQLISDLSDMRYLDFTATSFTNGALDADNVDELQAMLIRSLMCCIEPIFRPGVLNWQTLIRESTPDELKDIYNKKMEQKLFFEPPYRLIVPSKDEDKKG